VPGERATDREAHIHQGQWLQIWRLRAEGGRTYLGRSVARHGLVTEGIVSCPDRAPEVSSGQSRQATAEGPNGPRKGLMGEASKQRDS